MGISGLLPFLKKASRRAHIQDFKGQVAAVDAYCWLHKGAFSCADKLVKGEPTDQYVVYVMKQINLLLSHGIKPIMVFDGCHLPSKAATEAKRRENRERNRKKAKELLRQGNTREAQECFQRCVEVTSEMAFKVINACRERNIDVIVAPYEADAQLAYLNMRGIAQLVITEDSDLLVFGSKATVFKLDSNGGCVFIDQEMLHLALNIPRNKFSFEKFRNMTILSGCDYLPSLHGIGLAKACKFFNVTANTDIYNVLCRLPSYLNMPNLEVTQEYREGFMHAINTFLYQLVFDPITQTLCPLNQYPDNMGPEDFPYAGKFVGHERALQIALGNVNVQTGEVVSNFDPMTYKPTAVKSSRKDSKDCTSTLPSIWSNSPMKKKKEAPSLLNPGRSCTTGKKVIIPVPLFKKNVEIEAHDDLTEEDLQTLYSQPHKRKKTNASLENVQEWLGEKSGKDHESESLCEGYQDVDSTLAHPKVADKELCKELKPATASKVTRARNPFAKESTNLKKNAVPDMQYIGIGRFCKMRKTVIDSNTIVQSRYFSSSVQISSSSSEAILHSQSNKLQNQREDESPTKECENENMESMPQAESPQRQSFSSSSPFLRCSKMPQTNIFNWKKFSYKNSSNSNVKENLAAQNTFQSMTQKSNNEAILLQHSETLHDESILSEIDTGSQKEVLEEVSTCTPSTLPLSQASLYSDAASIDNESFDLTPLPTTAESSDFSPLRDATNCPSELHHSNLLGDGPENPAFISNNKCRTVGLSRTKKNASGKKQLTLTDMFSFKRDERP